MTVPLPSADPSALRRGWEPEPRANAGFRPRLAPVGAAIHVEVPSATGTLLATVLAEVQQWAARPARDRLTLFPCGATRRRLAALGELSAEPDLQAHLATIATLLFDGTPAADPLRVGRACGGIAAWAQAEGAHATALAFSAVAATVDPDAPERFELLAALAQQAAEARFEPEFDLIWHGFADLLRPGGPHHPRHATFLLTLGRAATAFNLWGRAELAGQRALDAAIHSGCAADLAEAEDFLLGLWSQMGSMWWPAPQGRYLSDAALAAVGELAASQPE